MASSTVTLSFFVDPCQVPGPPSTLPHRKDRVFFLVLCFVGERPQPAVELLRLHAMAEFGGAAFPVVFILLSRASIQLQDNWVRVPPNNSLCAEPRVITPFDPEVLLPSPDCCARLFLPLRINFLLGTAQLLQFSI